MPGTIISRGNVLHEWMVYAPAIVWSSATLTSTTYELTASVPGLQVGDIPYLALVNSAMTTNLSYSNIRVSAANTIAVTWVAGAAGLTIPTGPWVIGIIRTEVPLAQLPATAV